MTSAIVDLAQEFVAIRSDPDRPRDLSRILDLALLQVRDFTIERFEDQGSKSALVYVGTKRPKKFTVVLNGHLDVIPGKPSQYIPHIRGNRLYGVGSMDMKSNVACLIHAFKETAHLLDYPIALQLVTDEEIGGFHGTKHQVDRGVRADFVIAGETTNFDIVNRAKGVLWLKVSCRGKTAHGAYPWRGENALWKMQAFLRKLEQAYPVPTDAVWETTLNLSRIETENRTFNKIPDDCTAWLDIRYLPGKADSVLKKVKGMMPKGFRLEIVAKEPALFVKETNRYLQALKRADEQVTRKKVRFYGAQGTSDARHYGRVGCDGVEFGPVGGGIGTDHEWVDIPSLERYCEILKRFLLSLNP